jgi:hypothetical protein
LASKPVFFSMTSSAISQTRAGFENLSLLRWAASMTQPSLRQVQPEGPAARDHLGTTETGGAPWATRNTNPGSPKTGMQIVQSLPSWRNWPAMGQKLGKVENTNSYNSWIFMVYSNKKQQNLRSQKGPLGQYWPPDWHLRRIIILFGERIVGS